MRFRDVAGDCAKLSLNTLIDGEVVAIDENGRSSFSALQQSRTHAHIHVLPYEDVTHSFQSLRARHCS
jgi:ATP-dependent DNA ligase